MHRLLPGSVSFLALAFLLSGLNALTPQFSFAQEHPTDSKGMDISVAAGYVNLSPDSGPSRDNGFTAQANVTRYFGDLPVAPSFELRGVYGSGPAVTERTVLAGFRAQSHFRSFYPYIDFLGGLGSIVYATDPTPGDHEDSGFAYSYGGGVDINVTGPFQLKLDLQRQHWNLGENSYFAPNGGDYILTPTVFTLGVVYRIPFKPHFGGQ